jgi:nondiscriminating aspartyl-tRNA synthetase
MQRILSAELAAYAGRPVTIAGWIHRRRRLAAVSFLILRDRAGLAQVVVKEPGALARLDELGEETVVRVGGVVAENPQAPGGHEIVEPEIEPLTEPAHTPPLELWRPTPGVSLPVQLDNAPVSWRHPSVGRSTPIRSRTTPGGRTRSTWSSAGWSW